MKKRITITNGIYNSLADAFAMWNNGASVELIAADYNLELMGFVDYVPCLVDVSVSREQIINICDDCYDMEVAAYVKEDMSRYKWERDEDVIKYEKYGWVGDWLSDEFLDED